MVFHVKTENMKLFRKVASGVGVEGRRFCLEAVLPFCSIWVHLGADLVAFAALLS